MFCAQCGRELNDRANFCCQCGAALCPPPMPRRHLYRSRVDRKIGYLIGWMLMPQEPLAQACPGTESQTSPQNAD